MEEYVPGQVYENLIKMMGYRKIKLDHDPLDQAALVQKMNHFEYVNIIGGNTVIILIAPGSKYENKSAEFKKLIKTLPNKKTNAIFVSESELTIHIKKQLSKLRHEKPDLIIEDYDYSLFMVEIPKHAMVPKHEIMTQEEIDELCDRFYIRPDQLPKIHATDSPVVWIGGRPGMCIRIYRVSETAGGFVVYRQCIK